uniref:Uncharacterized protein n=1 Tax=Arundo donax TaxID=35708 RepID=A0A0A9CRH5_ARUDO
MLPQGAGGRGSTRWALDGVERLQSGG